MRSAVNPATDRFAIGRNGAGNAWVAVATDTTEATKFAAVNMVAGPAVIAGVREETIITVDVHGESSNSIEVDGFNAVPLANINNDASVVHSLVYLGAHEAGVRSAVMDALAAEYGIA